MLQRWGMGAGRAARDPQEQRIAAQVRQALRDLHRPARLTANPLLAWLELSNEHVTNKLHLSRSTYFRRLNHGINLLTARLLPPGR